MLRLPRRPLPHARLVLALAGLLYFTLAATPATAQTGDSGTPAATSVRIPGYERFHRQGEPTGSPEAGLLLLGELNCVACHEPPGHLKSAIDAKQAPVLTEVGSRVRPEYFGKLLSDPRQAKPGTTMPALFDKAEQAGSEQSKRQIESLAHFLASTGRPVERAPSPTAISRGREHFQRFGCGACHNVPEENARQWDTSVPFGDLLSKYTVVSLAHFLRDPLHVRPSGRMPDLNLSEQEANELASYLLRRLELPAGLTFQYYEGSWQKLPDFDQLSPKTTGQAFAFDVSVASRRDGFGLRFEGKLRVPREGDYTFHLGSDDGSRLSIDGSVVVENDNIHPFGVKSGKVRLEAGIHALRVDYFEQGGEERVALEVEGPGLPRQGAEGLLVVPDTGREPFEVNSELAAQGRQVFQQVGCAACHTLQQDGQPLRASTSAPPLDKLRPESGCLAQVPAAGLPRYALDERQRADLRAALRSTEAASPSPSDAAEATAGETIHQTMVRLNCYACHERKGVGGVEEFRNPLFTSNQPEMGDEGRIPPHLTGAGDKLRKSWLEQIFRQGAKDRPYMHTRMPRFGEGNAGHLAQAFEQTDQVADDPPYKTNIAPRRLKAAGRQMAGVKGYSCIKCHTFGDYQATGIQAISLTSMYRRLNHGWFHRYMLNPQAYRPGTRMPAAWPNGQVLLPKILANDADLQIHAVWTYLSDGNEAAAPLGLRTAPLELVPIDHAMLYRNFIEGAGTRAIGVGYPERVNLAFDANNLRLALLWHGPFIDASRHWTGRGQGFQPPLGHNVLQLPDVAPLARLADEQASWPSQSPRELDYSFLGYRLDKQGRPTFRYRFQNVTVEDTPHPAAENTPAGIRRTLRFSSKQTVPDLWWHVVTAGKIEDLGDGRFEVNDDWTVQLELPEGVTARIRKQGDQQQLLVAVPLADKPLEIVQQYDW